MNLNNDIIKIIIISAVAWILSSDYLQLFLIIIIAGILLYLYDNNLLFTKNNFKQLNTFENNIDDVIRKNYTPQPDVEIYDNDKIKDSGIFHGVPEKKFIIEQDFYNLNMDEFGNERNETENTGSEYRELLNRMKDKKTGKIDHRDGMEEIARKELYMNTREGFLDAIKNAGQV